MSAFCACRFAYCAVVCGGRGSCPSLPPTLVLNVHPVSSVVRTYVGCTAYPCFWRYVVSFYRSTERSLGD